MKSYLPGRLRARSNGLAQQACQAVEQLVHRHVSNQDHAPLGGALQKVFRIPWPHVAHKWPENLQAHLHAEPAVIRSNSKHWILDCNMA